MRRKCQECRLKKCLAVGMRPECVVPENQCAIKRKEKKAQKEKDKQQIPPSINTFDAYKNEIPTLMKCDPPPYAEATVSNQPNQLSSHANSMAVTDLIQFSLFLLLESRKIVCSVRFVYCFGFGCFHFSLFALICRSVYTLLCLFIYLFLFTSNENAICFHLKYFTLHCACHLKF